MIKFLLLALLTLVFAFPIDAQHSAWNLIVLDSTTIDSSNSVTNVSYESLDSLVQYFEVDSNNSPHVQRIGTFYTAIKPSIIKHIPSPLPEQSMMPLVYLGFGFEGFYEVDLFSDQLTVDRKFCESVYYFEGMRMKAGSYLSLSAIGCIERLYKGTPAKYGDVAPDVITITMKP